eukprot:TRINITY_DN7521_c0_g1_i1.p2 TRINITY_DN7521_c0_g1~~TRINITY_DN7521_c0_g1_i1.p2  ORF type:complete len:127 (-),score=13.25 TRINITY_DN7521_c0_g1_i1:301-657(-)
MGLHPLGSGAHCIHEHFSCDIHATRCVPPTRDRSDVIAAKHPRVGIDHCVFPHISFCGGAGPVLVGVLLRILCLLHRDEIDGLATVRDAVPTNERVLHGHHWVHGWTIGGVPVARHYY